MKKEILVNTAYFAPISYFATIQNAEKVLIEQYENFGKQSYRNRCEIMTANGKENLTVPVDKANSKTLIKDLKINYATDWQKQHYRSIESAYRNSPFYDYYIDEFIEFFGCKETYLLDLNNKITERVLECIQIPISPIMTQDYITQNVGELLDLRATFHPKVNHHDNKLAFEYLPYRQTFTEKIPFVENLSILDLIFCCGPDANPQKFVKLIT